jgi:hypothetical protein
MDASIQEIETRMKEAKLDTTKKAYVLYQIAHGNASYNPKELARFGITNEEIEKAKELAEHYGEEEIPAQKQLENKSD